MPAEVLGLLLEPQLGKRAHAEHRVADPAVAVVPVALAAEGLGQRGGGGGDQGPAGRVRQRLQDGGRAGYGGRLGPLQADLRPPAAPEAERLLEGLVQLLGGDPARRVSIELVGADEHQRQAHPLPRANAATGLDLSLGPDLAQVGVTGDDQAVVAADRGEQVDVLVADPRRHRAVVEARRHPDVEVHEPTSALDDPQELAVGVQRGLLADRTAVEHPRLAAGRAERRAQHQRVVDVVLEGAPPRLVGGLDRAEAAFVPVEQAPEAATGVEVGQAVPVD